MRNTHTYRYTAENVACSKCFAIEFKSVPNNSTVSICKNCSFFFYLEKFNSPQRQKKNKIINILRDLLQCYDNDVEECSKERLDVSSAREMQKYREIIVANEKIIIEYKGEIEATKKEMEKYKDNPQKYDEKCRQQEQIINQLNVSCQHWPCRTSESLICLYI